MFSGNDDCFDVFSGACPLSPGSSNTKFVLGGIEMSCGPNTVFSQAACACVHLPGGKLLVCLLHGRRSHEWKGGDYKESVLC